MEEPLSPREFLKRFHLPQLVRINEAHLHQLNKSRPAGGHMTISGASTNIRTRSLDSTATTNTASSTTSSSSYVKGGNSSTEEDVLGGGSDKKAKSRRNGVLMTTGKSAGKSPSKPYQLDGQLLDLDQPFLLYKAYSCRQVIANTLAPDSSADIANYKRAGPTLLIPENYTGWFAMVTSRGHTAGYFSTIDEVVKAQVPYFLTREDVKCYNAPSSVNNNRSKTAPGQPIQISNQTNKSSKASPSGTYDKALIKGGTVLKCLGVYEDISAFILGRSNLGKGSTRRKQPIEPGARYAKCVSFGNCSGGEVVFVPITETGRFYVIAKRAGQLSYNHVYSLSNLLRVVKLPATVQLIVGPKPRNHSGSSSSSSSPATLASEAQKGSGATFSAVLRLEDIRMREVILSSTIRPQPFSGEAERHHTSSKSFSSSIRRTLRGNRFASSSKADECPVLLEFDLDSSFTFVRTFVERNGTLSSRKIPELVLSRISYCNKEADLWKSQIKVAHDIIPRGGGGDRFHSLDLNSSGEELPATNSPTHNALKARSRPSIFDEEFKRNFVTNKNASITSRTSSNASGASRISKILQRFWNPLKKRREDEFSEIEEDVTESEGEDNDVGEGDDTHRGSLSKKKVPIEEDADFHFYETLKRSDEAAFFPPKQKLSRKQTLDVIFPISVDDDGYIFNSQNQQSKLQVEDPVYSTVC